MLNLDGSFLEFISIKNRDEIDKFKKKSHIVCFSLPNGEKIIWSKLINGIGLWPQSQTNRTELQQYYKIHNYGKVRWLYGNEVEDYLREILNHWIHKTYDRSIPPIGENEFILFSKKSKVSEIKNYFIN